MGRPRKSYYAPLDRKQRVWIRARDFLRRAQAELGIAPVNVRAAESSASIYVIVPVNNSALTVRFSDHPPKKRNVVSVHPGGFNVGSALRLLARKIKAA